MMKTGELEKVNTIQKFKHSFNFSLLYCQLEEQFCTRFPKFKFLYSCISKNIYQYCVDRRVSILFQLQRIHLNYCFQYFSMTMEYKKCFAFFFNCNVYLTNTTILLKRICAHVHTIVIEVHVKYSFIKHSAWSFEILFVQFYLSLLLAVNPY